MKLTFTDSLLTAVVSAAALLVSCNEKCEHLPGMTGTDCSITSVSIVPEDAAPEAYISNDTIIVRADHNFDFGNVSVEFTVSEGAAIDPLPETVQDWSQDMDFTVTSFSGENSRTYRYIVRREAIESYCQSNVYLTSQQEVNDFSKNNYTRVWSIVIKGSEESPVTDLSPLNSLIEIDYNLTIKGFQGKEIILDNLEKANSIDIYTDSVKAISFSKIKDLDKLYVGYVNEEETTTKKATLDKFNFPSLERIRERMKVNADFSDSYDYKGFESLRNAAGSIELIISAKNLKMLSSLESVNDLYIQGLAFESFEGLENLKTIEGTLTFCAIQINSLSPICPETVGSIEINSCMGLDDYKVFNNIEKLDNLIIMAGGKSLEGFDNLKEIKNKLSVSSCGMANLNNLSNLEHVGKSIEFKYNSKLEDYSGLIKCLRNFNGDWNVSGNKVNPSISDILGE